MNILLYHIKSPKIREFIRFCIVGASSAGLDMLIFYSTRIFMPYQFAMISGYFIGLVYNYFLTVFWTFKVKPTKQNAIGLVLAHCVNLFVIRMGLMWVFINIIGLSDRISYIPTLVISVFVNFIMVKCVMSFGSSK